MQKLLLSLTLVVWSAAGAAGEGPFAPARNMVDHVVTMVQNPSGQTRRVAYSDGWFRIDHYPKVGFPSSTYYDHPNTMSVRVVQAAGKYLTLSVMRERGRFHSEAVRTAERKTVLGEDCVVWNIRGNRHCVADDGIELWYEWKIPEGFAEATKIERRPVPASEVHLPADMLDPGSWIRTSAAGPTYGKTLAARPVDVETEMKLVEGQLGDMDATTTIFRRRHPWTWNDDGLLGGGRRLSIHNDESGFRLKFEKDAAGEFKLLSIFSPRVNPYDEHPPFVPQPRRRETILSEQCTWFYVWRRAESGRSECRTSDGVVLKEEEWSHTGWRRTLVAVRVQRRAIDLSEVMPPDDILKREKWGLP